MRVLFVIGGLRAGGAESQVILLARELARLGHPVSVYVLAGAQARTAELAGSGAEVTLDCKRRPLDLAVLARLRRHLRRWRPDIIHGFKYDGDLYARLAACGSARPVLGSERTDHQEVSAAQRLGYRLTSMLADGIVANTCAGAAFARRLHRREENEVDVIWNGIDLHEAAARVAASDRPARKIFPGAGLKRLCTVASIKPENDYPLALRVLRRLLDDDPAWRLICAGDEPKGQRGCRSEVLAECERLALGPFVRFVGHRRDALELIADSDVLLLTAVRGGFPNVALDAMAAGTVVVSTDYCDLRRVLPVQAQVVAPRAGDELARAVLRCYGDRAAVAQAQQRWLEQNCSAGAIAVAALRVYSKYLSLRAAPEPA